MTDSRTTFAKIDRKIIQWEWYTDIPTKVLFIHLFLVANHEPQNWRGHSIERGQRLTSLANLSRETGLTIQQVRTAIRKLKSTGEITSKSTNSNTVITIVNYEVYQSDYRESNTLNNIPSNKRITNEQQTDNKRVTTNKNVKNIKNDKKVINIGQDEPDQTSKQPTFFTTIKVNGKDRVDPKDVSHPFNVFWNEYPNRVKKVEAERSFKRNVKDWDTLKLIIVDIKERIAYGMWTEESKKYIPHPTTYLNNLQWEDEVDYSRYQKNNNKSSHNKFLDMLERGEFGE